MPIHPLAGARLKYFRAQEHAQLFEADYQRFLDTNSWTGIVKRDPETKEHVLKLHLLRSIPLEWSVLIGDFAHNARSVLDNVVWQLALKHCKGKIPRDVERQIQCPVATKREGWGNRIANYVSKSDLARIERFQPYHVSKPAVHPLCLLNEINRLDKHRAVILSIPVVDLKSVELDSGARLEINETKVVGFDPSAKPGAEVEMLRGKMLAPKGTEYVKVKLNLGIYISLEQASGMPHINVSDTLKEISSTVGTFLAEFAADFPA